jgi:hypothetical protein
METKFLAPLCLILSFGLWIGSAAAGIIPTLTISRYGTNAEVKVHGDPKSEIFLYYGVAGTPRVNLGTTDEGGNFSTPLSPANYGFGCGQTAYVSVNWQRSAVIPWVLDESGSLCRNLSLSQDNLSLRPGESATITVSDDDPFSISRVSAPDVATAEIERDKLTITALKTGTATFTICADGSACRPLSVRVSDDGRRADVSFSQTRPVLNVGQTQTLPIGGAGSYFIAANSNSAIASASLGGSNVTLLGLKAGTTNLIVCQADGQCATLFVTVTSPAGVAPATATGCEGGTAYSPLTGERCPSSTTLPPTSGAAPYRLSTFLQVNSTGVEVTELQKRLTTLGFYTGPITGRFGSLTRAAVKAFQKARGLDQAGYVGPATRAALNR